ncbi:MAG: DUF1304 family protein [Bdellovibrionales bacterium]
MKLEWLSFIFFCLASLVHLISFFMHAHFHHTPWAQKVLKIAGHEVGPLRPWLLIMGYSDLFLCLGVAWGLYYVLSLQIMLAGVLTGYAAFFMLALGLLRAWLFPQRRRLAVAYWLPPLLGLVLVFFHVKQYV